ncbi:MAG: tetratricopeptide repeat protein [Burkholderiales bacterium]
MSLINKMLQDLDKRGGAQVGAMPRPTSDMSARNVKRIGSEWFWRVLAALMLLAVAWVAWLIWELRPRPVVTELATRAMINRVVAPAVHEDVGRASVDHKGNSATGVSADLAAPTQKRLDGLRLSTELSASSNLRSRATNSVVNDISRSGQTADTGAARIVGERGASARAKSPPRTPVSATSLPDTGIGVPPLAIDKRDTSTPRDRADAELRRAMVLGNQRRSAESLEAMRMALAIDVTHESARNAMVASLLEAKRFDEATQALIEGLSLNPKNSAFAMSLARIAFERGDVTNAMTILEKNAPAAQANADYRAFRAALQQRAGRHAEAADEYRAALTLAAETGRWWIGLGISQQALSQSREALESFRRARDAGNLTPELRGFAEQRIAQLQ